MRLLFRVSVSLRDLLNVCGLNGCIFGSVDNVNDLVNKRSFVAEGAIVELLISVLQSTPTARLKLGESALLDASARVI
jgi:hypothetical protein